MSITDPTTGLRTPRRHVTAAASGGRDLANILAPYGNPPRPMPTLASQLPATLQGGMNPSLLGNQNLLGQLPQPRPLALPGALASPASSFNPAMAAPGFNPTGQLPQPRAALQPHMPPFQTPQTAAAGAGGAAPVAAPQGRIASALNRVPAPGAHASATNFLGLPKWSSPARGIGVGIGAPIAAHYAGEALGGDDSFMGRLVQGAGPGAGIGSLLGPKGALVGGAATGLFNAFFGGGDGGGSPASHEETLSQAISQGQVDPAMAEQIMTQYAVAIALGNDKDEAFEMAKAQVLGAVGSANQQQQPDYANTLAVQRFAQETFEPLAERAELNADIYNQQVGSMLDSLPAHYQPLAELSAAQASHHGTRLADAYRSQAQLLPAMESMRQYQGQVASLAQQQLNSALAGQQQGGAGIEDILAGLL